MIDVGRTMATAPPLPLHERERPPTEVLTEATAFLDIGLASRSPPGKANEDYAGIADPDEAALRSHGRVVAVADGIGGDGSGQRGARVAVDMVLQDYYGTAATWAPSKALDRVLRACNDWLHAQNSRRHDADGKLASLSVLVFRQGRYHLAHVGDCRVYRIRHTTCKQITTDHVWPKQDMRHVPKRAMGLDSHIVVDYADGDVLPGDRFALVTDGIWEVLGDAAVVAALTGNAAPQACADALVAGSLARQATYMGRNDATAAVIRAG